jgi:hypothetical protein
LYLGFVMSRPAQHIEFFRIWTVEMAYILGYWWADGCMRVKSHGAHEIEIASLDIDHLLVMARTIGAKYWVRKVTAVSETIAVTFCSKEMYYDLLAHGGTPRKSRTIGFPAVPTEFLPHFVRGVIDGDGTLAWNGDRPVLQIYSGSHQFLQDIVVAIERETGIPAPNVTANRNNWYVKWSTVRAKCLTGWLYVDNRGLALPRKAAIATQFLAWQPKKRPERGTITDAMRLKFADYLAS